MVVMAVVARVVMVMMMVMVARVVTVMTPTLVRTKMVLLPPGSIELTMSVTLLLSASTEPSWERCSWHGQPMYSSRIKVTP